MKKRKMISLILAAAFSAALFVGCDSMNAETSGENGNTAGSSDHPVITMNAPYRNMSCFTT
ncbi:MAG: hypothetical protein J6A19_06620 [Oscillospiraceae bacterium]|nr:hypothetical protein [Oscillospiraceae bacterium]